MKKVYNLNEQFDMNKGIAIKLVLENQKNVNILLYYRII